MPLTVITARVEAKVKEGTYVPELHLHELARMDRRIFLISSKVTEGEGYWEGYVEVHVAAPMGDRLVARVVEFLEKWASAKDVKISPGNDGK